MITLPPLPHPVDLLWDALLELGEISVPWTLVGGQMVLLHALEHGQQPPVISQDGDVVANIRAAQSALKALVTALEAALGFELEAITTDGRAHRYTRPAGAHRVVIDVLAPEGLGPNTDLTTSSPGRTIEVPAGTQALGRTSFVQVRHGKRVGRTPRPSLLGAIVLKAAACTLRGDSARHERDLALLCALVPDPFAMRAEMSAKDLTRVRRVAELTDPGCAAWMLVPEAIRAQGVETFAILTDVPPVRSGHHA
jgi:hypothetical protein